MLCFNFLCISPNFFRENCPLGKKLGLFTIVWIWHFPPYAFRWSSNSGKCRRTSKSSLVDSKEASLLPISLQPTHPDPHRHLHRVVLGLSCLQGHQQLHSQSLSHPQFSHPDPRYQLYRQFLSLSRIFSLSPQEHQHRHRQLLSLE